MMGTLLIRVLIRGHSTSHLPGEQTRWSVILPFTFSIMMFHMLFVIALAYVVALSAGEEVSRLNFSDRPASAPHWSNFSTASSAPKGTSPCRSPPKGNKPQSSSTPVTSASTRDHSVDVGASGNFLFRPDHLNASVGDVVRFNFLALNHTLTQSELSDPCLSNGGFNTGFRQFNPLNESGKFVVEFKVNTTRSQWFYCAQTIQASHCHRGMVFGLNPSALMKQFVDNALALNTTERSASNTSWPTATNNFAVEANRTLGPASFQNQTFIGAGVLNRSGGFAVWVPLIVGGWTVILSSSTSA